VDADPTWTLVINAPPEAVWDALINPTRMPLWMGEPEMAVEVHTTWAEGRPITIRAFHHEQMENTGTVLKFDPTRALTYTQLSSISRLPDVPENHSVVAFVLHPEGGHTRLTLTVSGFPTETIRKHLEFYWRGTLQILKRFVEG
jgi:uncharacterized protein YndB with AHSA1/START domain